MPTIVTLTTPPDMLCRHQQANSIRIRHTSGAAPLINQFVVNGGLPCVEIGIIHEAKSSRVWRGRLTNTGFIDF